MKNYLHFTFLDIDASQSAILIAVLDEIGFTGFEELDRELSAFIPEKDFSESAFNEVVASMNISWEKKIIQETNWNAVWESNFEPIRINDFVAIRAEFHAPIVNVENEIVITPKMSFGTGHHATTHLMVELMRNLHLKNKRVFDFGTGTGILAILAEKLGAANVFAIDNDQWSIDNTLENIQRNDCSKVEVVLLDQPPINQQFDVVLANINKSIILQFLESIYNSTSLDGAILLSGLLKEDEADILQAVKNFNLQVADIQERKGWIALYLTKR
jgi:ribosomal protein L11 methyltransferase